MQVLDPESSQQAVTRPGQIEVAMTRAAQEVQAALVVAKRFPRDVNAAYARIIQGCKRKALAEQSAYVYPRGGTKVSGPSIRLAEHLAQNWGNFESGVIELERRDGESVAMAYAWDLETNSRDVKVFTVAHVRERGEAKGGNVQLTDPRDLYEIVANQGARRKRACILALIPGDITDAAEAECEKTLKGDNTELLVDRIRKMATVFQDLNVTSAMLEKRLGHKLEALNEAELVSLRKIYTSIKDGMSTLADWFTTDPSDQPVGKASFGFKQTTPEPKEKSKKKGGGVQPEPPSETPPTKVGAPGPGPSGPQQEGQAPEQGSSASAVPQTGLAAQQTQGGPDASLTPGSLLRSIQATLKEKGVSLDDLNAWVKANPIFGGRPIVQMSVGELQAVCRALNSHTKGERFG